MMKRRYRRIRWTHITILTLYVLSGTLASAYADSRTQAGLYSQGILYYDENVSCANQVGSPTLVGSDAVEQAYNYFAQQAGMTPAAAAGILGNLMVESGVDPTKLQNDFTHEHPAETLTLGQITDTNLGWGIAQWTPPNSIIKNNPHTPGIDTLGYQLQFLWNQLKSNPNYYELPQLKAASTPEQAADVFEAGFERASTPVLSLREKDARSVYNKYATNGVTPAGVPAPTSTDGNCAGGQLSGNFPFYSQCDPKWGSDPYSGSTICAAGCGPTSMAMILSALTGTSILPSEAAAYATTNNDYVVGQGSKWSIGPDLAKHWNLKSSPVSSVAGVTSALQSGGLVIVAGTGGLPFTTSGHFIVIRAVAPDGKWLLADPDTATGHSNTAEWDPQAVVSAGIEWGSAYIITK